MRPSQDNVPFGEKVLARQISAHSMDGVKSQVQVWNLVFMRSNSEECCSGAAEVGSDLAKPEDPNRGADGTKGQPTA